MENQQNQIQEQKIKMYPVHSTNVSSIGWYKCMESKRSIMVVEFSKGAKYMYFDVLNEKFSEALASDSIGKWVQDNLVRNKEVTCMKIGQPKLEL